MFVASGANNGSRPMHFCNYVMTDGKRGANIINFLAREGVEARLWMLESAVRQPCCVAIDDLAAGRHLVNSALSRG